MQQRCNRDRTSCEGRFTATLSLAECESRVPAGGAAALLKAEPLVLAPPAPLEALEPAAAGALPILFDAARSGTTRPLLDTVAMAGLACAPVRRRNA